MPKDSPISAASAVLGGSPVLSYAEFASLGRDTITAAIDSNAAFSAGVEAISREIALGAQIAFESAGETARGFLGARTFEDVVRLQTDFAKRNFDTLVAQSAKLSELGCSLLDATVGAWSARAKIAR